MSNAPEPWGRTRGVVFVLAASWAASCAAPGSEPPAADLAWLDQAGRLELDGSALVIHSGGVGELLADPRDAGLRQALTLLDERLLELTGELGGEAAPPGTIEFLCEALCEPWTLRVDLDAGGLFSVRAQWTVQPASPERAAALAARFAGVMEAIGQRSTPSREEPTLLEIELPFGSLFHGTSRDGRAFVVAWGEPEEEALDLATAGLPASVRPGFAFGLDYGALTGAILGMIPGDDAEKKELAALLAGFGLGGDTPRRITFAGGQDAERAHLVARDAGWTRATQAMGGLAEGPIPPAALALVPDDAALVSIGRFEPSAITRVLALSTEEGAEENPLAGLEAALGIALGPDLLEPLGQAFGFYLSETTGGSDLASAVAFVAVDDAARLAATLDTLAARVDALGASVATGRVRTRPFEHGGARGHELVFPGLPVPLRPTMALHDGYLLAAGTPQALTAALDWAGHATPRDDGYIDCGWGWRAHFEPASVGALDDVQSLVYLDTPRLARQGYGLAALLAAAVANGLRSPADAERDPGQVLPPLHELLRGARPVVSLSRVCGDDLVTAVTMDRSASVHLAAALGFAPAVTSGILLGGTLGALFGSDGDGDLELEDLSEPEDPNVVAAQDAIWMLLDALEGHASEHDGVYPESLEELLEPDADGLSWLAEIPRDPWGNEYILEILGEDVRVISYGADGVPGGEGLDADISSDELGYYESWEEYEDDGMWFDLDEEPTEPEDEDEG